MLKFLITLCAVGRSLTPSGSTMPGPTGLRAIQNLIFMTRDSRSPDIRYNSKKALCALFDCDAPMVSRLVLVMKLLSFFSLIQFNLFFR